MRRLHINKKNINIHLYYESTTNYRFLRTFIYICILILWLCIIYNTFSNITPTVNKFNFNSIDTNKLSTTSSNDKKKAACCYTSSYYNISYHNFGDLKILEFSNKKKNTAKTKSYSKLDNIKYKLKSSYKIHKNTQRDGSTVTIVKYKGKFYIFYDDEY